MPKAAYFRTGKKVNVYIYITLSFFSALSPFPFILALWQSCVLTTVVLINEYE